MDPGIELDRDDKDDLGVDETVEEIGEDEADVYVPPMGEDEVRPAKRMVLEIFTCAWPKDFFKRTLRGISETEPIKQVVAFTTSASPGLPLALFDLDAESFIWYDRVTKHSYNHGQEIFRDAVYNNFLLQEPIST